VKGGGKEARREVREGGGGEGGRKRGKE